MKPNRPLPYNHPNFYPTATHVSFLFMHRQLTQSRKTSDFPLFYSPNIDSAYIKIYLFKLYYPFHIIIMKALCTILLIFSFIIWKLLHYYSITPPTFRCCCPTYPLYPDNIQNYLIFKFVVTERNTTAELHHLAS